MTTPFTYLLYHEPTGYWYYGVRYARNCCPSDIWTKYFSSSRAVQSLIEEYGKESFTVSIRRIFDTPEKAIEWERKVLKRMKVISNPISLNKNCAGEGWRKAKLTEYQKKKISVGVKDYAAKNPKLISKRSSKIAKNFWKNMTTEKRDALIQKRREQINPMQGKSQKRLSCISCRKETTVNNFPRHKC